MKAAPFDYVAVSSVDDVLDQLACGGDDAMILAGGQTLVPMLVMRLARPSILIDINSVNEFSGVDEADGVVRIKTCTRQSAALLSVAVLKKLPLLAKAMRFIGHHQTRNRGTFGGSVAHGDPAAEIPIITVAVDATITVRSKETSRTVLAGNFYEGPMITKRGVTECLIDVTFPIWNGGGRLGTSFQEVSQRQGDFAVVSAAAQILLDDAGVCRRIALALGGVGGVPIRLKDAELIFTSNTISAELIGDALQDMEAALDPANDTIASADYRLRVARVMIERVIREAVSDAGGTIN